MWGFELLNITRQTALVENLWGWVEKLSPFEVPWVGRAQADREAFIKDSGLTKPGMGVTILCLYRATGPGRDILFQIGSFVAFLA